MKLVLFVFALFCAFGASYGAQYYPGDLVRLSKRSQNGNKMTTWTPLTSSLCPRFQQSKTIELPAITDDVLLAGPAATRHELAGKDFRFMLAFDDMNFISPHFAVKDLSRGVNLVMLNIVFIFNGPNIIDVKWDADYNDHNDHNDFDIKPIIVTYNWEQFSEEDIIGGLAGILIYGLFVALGMLGYIFFSESENMHSLSTDFPTVFQESMATGAPQIGSIGYAAPPLGIPVSSIPVSSFKSD